MTRSQAGWWMIGGGIVAIVGGMFLPWATLTAPLIGSIDHHGSEGDGFLVAIGSVLVIIGGLKAKSGNRGDGGLAVLVRSYSPTVNMVT